MRTREVATTALATSVIDVGAVREALLRELAPFTRADRGTAERLAILRDKTDDSAALRDGEDLDAVLGPLLRPGGEHLPGSGEVQFLGAVEERDGDRPAYLVCGNPRSTFEVAGSGQRDVTTFPRV